MATIVEQRAAIGSALTAASIGNSDDPTKLTVTKPMVITFSAGASQISIRGAYWGFRLACIVGMDAKKSATTALTAHTVAVLAVLWAMTGCRIVGVGPESRGTTEGGLPYLAADINVELPVTI